MRAVISAVSLGFMPAVGSSSSSRTGSLASARASLEATLVAVGQVLAPVSPRDP